jgi:hypothetical protein
VAYTFTGRQTGTVRFEQDDNGIVNKETESFNSRVTSNPVESGADINDHVINDSQKLNVSGVIIGGNAARAALLNMREKRDIVTYTGRTRVSNLVFTQLTFDYDAKNKDGSAFKAQLQEVIINSAQVVDVGAVPMTAQDAGKSGTSQANQTANAGMQTVATQSVSGAAYADYVSSYNGDSSPGPETRTTASYNGITAN